MENNFRALAKASIQGLLKRFNLGLFSLNHQGLNLYVDLYRSRIDFKTVFDVGANVGQTTKTFYKKFNKTSIWAFEPVQSNYEKLVKNTANLSVQCHKLAMSDHAGKGKINLMGHDQWHSLEHGENALGSQVVQLETIDRFCSSQSIEHINLLKIDTEGADLKVLHGAKSMINENRIDFILVESCFETGLFHVDIRAYFDFFEPENYRFFGMYDQMRARNKSASVRYANICFARPGLILAE